MNTRPYIPSLPSLLVAAGLFVGGSATGQTVGPVTIGQRVKLHSNVLNEERVLWIYRPDTAEGSSTRYPVLYLLDGDTHFIHTAGIVQFLADVGRMPKILVVGIESTDRIRDFTPPPADTSMPSSGGADAFLGFMSTELIPYVESHYRTAPFRILAGHSIGGTFALHVLLTRPEEFNSYMLISPNLWWGNNVLIRRLEGFLGKKSALKAFVYETHTVRESPRQSAVVPQLLNLIETYRPEGLQWKVRILQDETHASIVHRSLYDGMEFIYPDWEPTGDLLATGMAGLLKHYRELSSRYGYQIDAPESMVNSLGYQHLGRNDFESAISVFRWNAQHYPGSWNVYDSLGEAYARKGDTALAVENYRKAIALNPDDRPGIEAVRTLSKAR